MTGTERAYLLRSMRSEINVLVGHAQHCDEDHCTVDQTIERLRSKLDQLLAAEAGP